MKIGKSPRFEEIPYKDLVVHELVQRPRVGSWVKKLMAEWVQDVDVLTVVRQGGVNKIIDGQHRWAAATALGLGDSKARCLVYIEPSLQEQAELFRLENNSRKPTPYDDYEVGLLADDPACVGVRDVLARYGLAVVPGTKDGGVRCVASALQLYEKDPALLDDVVGTLVAAWGTRAAAFEKPVFNGMALVLGRYNGELDRPSLIKKLSGYPSGPAGLLGQSRGLAKLSTRTVTRAVAENIVGTYNKGRRKGQVDPL